MITYNVKDLIQQATMLADLQNSDFISWKENIIFLDNAWTELYQKLINHGDKTFIKEFTFDGDKTLLPDDFYQLYYISFSNGFFERPINRKAKTSTESGPYYDIVGNELIISGRTMPIGSIKVKYFPIKNGLTYAANNYNLVSRNIDLDVDLATKNIIDVNNSYVLTNEAIYDIINGKKIKDIELIDDHYPIMMTPNYDVIIDGTEDNIAFAKVDNRTFEIVYDDVNKTLIVYKYLSNRGNALIKIPDVEENPELPRNQINTFTEDGIYYIDNDTKKVMFYSFSSKEKSEYAESTIGTTIVSFHNDVYYETIEGICKNNAILIPAEDYGKFDGVMKVDLDSGYGILTDTYTLRGVFEDTEMAFPSNFYYNYLAYRLAVYYKIKQNADPSGLLLQLSKAEETFYDTLPRDENEFVRISNVYAK